MTVAINHGHDMAEMVRDSDPDGHVVAHAINRTQTMADRLRHEGLIEGYQWQAACDLRALWRLGRPIADVVALDPAKVGRGHGERDPEPRADITIRRLARALGTPRWIVIERLVYDDLDPREWGARLGLDGLAVTCDALDALARKMGLS